MPPIDLAHATTADLTCALVCRVIEREHGVVDPILGVIRLAAKMGSMLRTSQRYQIASAMRDAADALEELPELVSDARHRVPPR